MVPSTLIPVPDVVVTLPADIQTLLPLISPMTFIPVLADVIDLTPTPYSLAVMEPVTFTPY